ncbi:hypothetical protein GUITHDRAFT_63902 [Guillardia theta CCMP2712]|uniref:Enoyl reductase (ER) domain-containing protein n=1 Tax=Guillardia theta (strain CCMP2712) TaxID=905079 RepID=L1K199_GUITC|nr:hypothetical protein GUITHDRAFT_63902 [Guillardia theta CCMP2712]EKX54158.1 hypothetical protein GUITHDRAFT_63902 [Guillardia theta CCMP2712]|eukprot:XP_005841138.1 hypothetical protein GUITHDRAFT_63902 [Guillardia theta CCMP2712]
MKAWTWRRGGRLEPRGWDGKEGIEIPTAGEGELLVRVHAASLNPIDWKTMDGAHDWLLRMRWPRVPCFDFSGEVVKVGGAGAGGRWKEGDRVFGMIRGLPQLGRGALAEYMVVDEDVCAACPPSFSHVDCASLPLVAITALKAFRACRLQERSQDHPRVLVAGGAGGVGTVAIQIVRNMMGAEVVATASPGRKTTLCEELGARVVNYHEEWVKKLEEEGCSFDVVLDCVGDAKRCARLLKEGGSLCSIVAGGTQDALLTWLDDARVDPRSITMGVEVVLRSSWGGQLVEFFSGAAGLRSLCRRRGGSFFHVIGAGDGELMGVLAEAMGRGQVKPVIDSVFSFEDALAAFAKSREGHAGGKIVVEIRK